MFINRIKRSILKLTCISLIILGEMTGVFFSPNAKAQVNDTLISADTTINVSDSLVRTHSPRKAVMYSLMVPGLGQIYNKKFWKIPFIYGAGGAFLYYVNYNQMKYKKFKNALFDQRNTKKPVLIDGYTYKYDELELGRDYFRRYRDLSIAGLAAIYLINAIDAFVDAYFFYYDISDDLSMRIEPAVIQNIDIGCETASLGFRINFGF